MAIASFPSTDAAEIVEVEFVVEEGAVRSLKMLVDTGFTGKSSLVVDVRSADVIRAMLLPTATIGALQGLQPRGWVTCGIPTLGFQITVIAIVTDVAALDLPDGVSGLIGLNFLRLFARWGGERTHNGWQFVLVKNDD